MKYIKEGTEFLDQLKDRVHDLYDENKELKQEIEKLNNNIKEAIKLLDIYFSNGINVQEPKDKIKKILKRS